AEALSPPTSETKPNRATWLLPTPSPSSRMGRSWSAAESRAAVVSRSLRWSATTAMAAWTCQPGHGLWERRHGLGPEPGGLAVYVGSRTVGWKDRGRSRRFHRVCASLHRQRSAGFHLRDQRNGDAELH